MKKLFAKERIILVLILMLMVVYTTSRDWDDLYYVEQLWDLDYEDKMYYEEISEEKTLVQEFQADCRHIQSIGVLFGTYSNTLTESKVRFTLRDSNGQELYEEVVAVQDLEDNGYYDFQVDLKVNKGEYYTYELYAFDYENEPSPAVWAGEAKTATSTLYYEGEEQNQELFSRMSIVKFQVAPVILNVVMFVLIAILLLVPLKVNRLAINIIGTIGILIFPCVSFFLVESLYQNPFGKDFLTIGFNYLLYLAFYLVFLILTGQFRWAILIGNTVTFVLGLVNYFVIQFRGVPICPWDIFSINTAADVAQGYRFEFDVELVSRILCMLTINLFALRLRKHRIKLPIRVVAGVGTVAYIAGIFYLFLGTPILEENGFEADLWEHKAGYERNGFYLSFVMNMQYIHVEKPAYYSPQKVEGILEEYEEDWVEQSISNKPNIIMIMNEAYSDLSVVGEFETNVEVTPYYNSLRRNAVKGSLVVSTFGGGTCNSEYEVLTGNSMAYLAKGSMAYQQYVNEKNKTGGLTMTLKEQGYTCYAIHPMLGSNWNRDTVYESMGFDKFYDVTDFPEEAERVRDSYISDLETYKKIIQMYEEKDSDVPMFVFDVTVQNHSGYLTNSRFEEPVVLEDMVGDYPAAEEYLSLLKVSDNALKCLIEYFRLVEEPTMIVMFGDHQPGIEEEFYEELLDKGLNELTLEEVQKRYEVPFMIWTNYNIREEMIEGMSANYLPGQVLKYAGLEIPKYFAFQNIMLETIPVINANGYRDAEGNDYTFDEESEYTGLLEQYKILHYNSAVDRSFTWFPMYTYIKK